MKGGGPWAKLNEGYESYAAQMGFVIDPARIRTPRDKGKVERRNGDSRHVLIRPGEVFSDLEELQRVTDERVRSRSKQPVSER